MPSHGNQRPSEALGDLVRNTSYRNVITITSMLTRSIKITSRQPISRANEMKKRKWSKSKQTNPNEEQLRNKCINELYKWLKEKKKPESCTKGEGDLYIYYWLNFDRFQIFGKNVY
ncbi:hypothetical protein BpHYR1_009293 [Brachionus plicatilis]|uniref:Uncharacterized protein n=1 Tax=Brachionus plicatilis TaxID=10195 RepID=A0A3M7T287_BRAPC|nr:hypothetical protein BpHYR1_009293 [Brachionus plicatilis]